MSKKSFSGFCKDCGIEFKTSELGNFSNQVLGNGTASRCAVHRKNIERDFRDLEPGIST